jgi:hypothetical protein
MVIPVFSVSHLKEEINKTEQAKSSIRSIIFLNCGGFLDLTTCWFYDQNV